VRVRDVKELGERVRKTGGGAGVVEEAVMVEAELWRVWRDEGGVEAVREGGDCL